MPITVLKNNVPWGPFTRSQIQEGLARGDFTLQYLAHGPGLKEWLPLGEVLDHFDRGIRLPPVPGAVHFPVVPRADDLPAVPKQNEPGLKSAGTSGNFFPPSPHAPVAASAPTLSPSPVSAPSITRTPGQPPALPVVSKPKPRDTFLAIPVPPAPVDPFPAPAAPAPVPPPPPVEMPKAILRSAPFIPRFFAFAIDCAVLFVPIVFLFALGALTIEIQGSFERTDAETMRQEWSLLWRNFWDLLLLVSLGGAWLYAAPLECSRWQGTVGKQWVGIKVTDRLGERLSFFRATGRHVAKCLSALPCFLGFTMACFSAEGLALHDRIASTRVVRK